MGLFDDNGSTHGGVFEEDFGHFAGQSDATVAFRGGCYNAFMHPDAGVGELHAEVHGRALVGAARRHRLPGGIIGDEGVTRSIDNAAVGGGLVVDVLFQNGERTAGGAVPCLTGRNGTPTHLAPADVVFGFLEVGVNDDEVGTLQPDGFIPMPGTDGLCGAQFDFFGGKGVGVGDVVESGGVAGCHDQTGCSEHQADDSISGF